MIKNQEESTVCIPDIVCSPIFTFLKQKYSPVRGVTSWEVTKTDLHCYMMYWTYSMLQHNMEV